MQIKSEVRTCLCMARTIQAIHSIRYSPIFPWQTFMCFSLYSRTAKRFYEWDIVKRVETDLKIPLVPVLFEGEFTSRTELQEYVEDCHNEESALGGVREGVVIRLARAYDLYESDYAICKTVRVNHVQENSEHWQKNWEHCKLKRD